MKKIISRKRRKLFIKRFKFFIIIVLIWGLVFSIKMVNAGTNDSKILKNRIQDVYAVTKLNGEDRIFYLNVYTMNGYTAYCIELGVDITVDVYNSTYEFANSKLSNEKIEYVKNLSYFGYGYEGHTGYKYYMATQELIWEYISNVEVEWVSEMKVDGKRIDISSYKKEILDLVNDYNEGIELIGYSDNMRVNIGDRLMLIDANNSLKYYDMSYSDRLEISDNKGIFNIDFDSNYIGVEKVILKRKSYYDHDSLLFYKNNSQKLISNGNYDERLELVFNVSGVNIDFKVLDNSGVKSNNQNNFLGINYRIYNKNNDMVEIIKSNEVGDLFLENVFYGEYCIKQVSTNSAYKLNEDEICFSFDKDTEVVYLNVEPVLYDIKFLKLYGIGNSLFKENGAVFNIYNVDGSLYDSLITGDDGIGTIKLPYGKYVVKQVKGVDGYKFVTDFEIDATGDKKNIDYTLVDESFFANLLINSKDNDGNFVNDENIYYKVLDINNDKYLEIDGNSELKGNDGKLLLPCMWYGKYRIEVINKTLIYKNIIEIMEIEIGNDSNFYLVDGQLYLDVDFNFELIKGSVKVISYKEKFYGDIGNYYYENVLDKNKKLELIANGDIINNGKVIYKKGDKVIDFITNYKGEYLINNLDVGDYCIFNKGKREECFSIIDSEMMEIKIVDKLNKGNVVIHNISDNLEDISGSIIEIYDNNKVIYRGITNDDGIIKIDDLVYGEYCFRQKNVSNNYKINDKEYCFKVDSENLIELEISNDKVVNKLIKIPNTYSDKKDIKKLIVLIIFILGVVIYKIKVNSISR